ncbi:MAG: sigma-70 family RNA polymerase sigma factor [Candidatus Omnitrophica bacterium]|nr:sigma-70 family RNA polymerase sigma factor [Candidatus Omnitrophota bacterium]
MTKNSNLEDEVKTIKLIRKGDRKAKEQFTRDNQGLVIYIAKKYAYSSDILPDLIAEGNMGLLKAIDKFDSKRNVKFGTYAYFWIKRFIIRAIMREFEVLKIPERYQEFRDRVEEMKRDYMFKNGRNPTDAEIAKSLKLPPEIVKKLRKYAAHVRVISSDYYDGEKQVDLFDVVDFSKKEEQGLWEVLRNKDILEKIFERIKKREKRANIGIWLRVLELYYGLDGGIQRSYKEISEELDVSRQRVHQIKKICLQKLKAEWLAMKKNSEEEDNEES